LDTATTEGNSDDVDDAWWCWTGAAIVLEEEVAAYGAAGVDLLLF
jgi:hypothetical protein